MLKISLFSFNIFLNNFTDNLSRIKSINSNEKLRFNYDLKKIQNKAKKISL